MDEIESTDITAAERKIARKAFSRVGLALFTVLAVATVLQLIGLALTRIYKPELFSASWYSLLMSLIPMYIVAFPLGYLILKRSPANRPTEYCISFRKLMEFLLMCFCIMYIGNFIGSALSMIISDAKGSDFENPLIKLLETSDIYLNFLLVVMVAPVMEELVFRKLLLDRIRVYGEATAILVSGLTFGLFHENLFQFFYAFGIGSMFAYIYLRTGRIRYSIILHSFINFFGGILPIILFKYGDFAEVSKLSGSDPQQLLDFARNNPLQLIAYGIYMLAVIAAFIGGLALLIDKRKKILLMPVEKQLTKGSRFKTVFLNAGMTLFALLALGLMTYTAIAV
jgi:uncharacterized protein